jgi:hypothetical protein
VCEQLEATNERAIKLSTALAQAEQQRDAAIAAQQALERRQVTPPAPSAPTPHPLLEAAQRAARAPASSHRRGGATLQGVMVAEHRDALVQREQEVQAQAAHKAEQLDHSLRDFVRTQVLQVLTTQDEEEQNQMVMLSDELCLHKAKETVLLERIAGMQHRQDVLRRQLTAAKESSSRAEERLADALKELAPLRASAALPDSVASVEQLVQERDDGRACMAKLAGQLQVERSNLVRAREETLAQIARREEVEARELEAAEALRLQRAAHDKELATQKAMLLEEMRRSENEIKAQWEASAARQVPPAACLLPWLHCWLLAPLSTLLTRR